MAVCALPRLSRSCSVPEAGSSALAGWHGRPGGLLEAQWPHWKADEGKQAEASFIRAATGGRHPHVGVSPLPDSPSLLGVPVAGGSHPYPVFPVQALAPLTVAGAGPSPIINQGLPTLHSRQFDGVIFSVKILFPQMVCVNKQTNK